MGNDLQRSQKPGALPFTSGREVLGYRSSSGPHGTLHLPLLWSLPVGSTVHSTPHHTPGQKIERPSTMFAIPASHPPMPSSLHILTWILGAELIDNTDGEYLSSFLL